MLTPLLCSLQVEQLSHMLDAMLPPAENANFLGPDITEAIFLSALTWSLGGGLLEDGRLIFDQLMKRLASMPQNPAEGAAVGPGEWLHYVRVKLHGTQRSWSDRTSALVKLCMEFYFV